MGLDLGAPAGPSPVARRQAPEGPAIPVEAQRPSAAEGFVTPRIRGATIPRVCRSVRFHRN